MFVFSRVKYRVLTVRHMIYDRHCLWSCIPELHTMSLLFDISSMTFLFYVCVFQSSIVCPYCSTFHLWSPLLMFISSRENITSLMFDASSMIVAIHACVFQRSNMVSLMFDISPMVIIRYACVYKRYTPVPNVWHIIYDCHYPCMCLPDIQTGSLMFDISSMIIVLNVWVFQS